MAYTLAVSKINFSIEDSPPISKGIPMIRCRVVQIELNDWATFILPFKLRKNVGQEVIILPSLINMVKVLNAKMEKEQGGLTASINFIKRT